MTEYCGKIEVNLLIQNINVLLIAPFMYRVSEKSHIKVLGHL